MAAENAIEIKYFSLQSSSTQYNKNIIETK